MATEIKLRPSTPCVEWEKAKDLDGYGVLGNGLPKGRGKRQLRAHRVAWSKQYGPIPADMFVLHRCDNPACVRVDHLFLGTHADNMIDRTRKGRDKHGVYHGRAKISEQTAVRIKALKGVVHAVRLAEVLNVKKSQICNIMNGNSWSHINAQTRYGI